MGYGVAPLLAEDPVELLDRRLEVEEQASAAINACCCRFAACGRSTVVYIIELRLGRTRGWPVGPERRKAHCQPVDVSSLGAVWSLLRVHFTSDGHQCAILQVELD